MLLIIITHAEARSVEPRHSYRGLTENGREQVKRAAAEFYKMLPTIAPTLDGTTQAIGKIVSSPLARCLETVLLFADELQPLTKTSEVYISDQLKEKRGEQLKPDDLVAVAAGARDEVILIGTHGDLAGALPLSTRLIDDAYAKDKSFFNLRPVVVVVDYEPGTPWESARVLYCHGYKDSPWKDLLAH
jgi:phosphohistidine phosphatase SixA